jgi:hypothetical protein
METRKYRTIAEDLREHIDGQECAGGTEKLIREVGDAAAFSLSQLDRHPEFKMGVGFMLQSVANAIASRRVIQKCLGRDVELNEELAFKACAVAIARAASQIKLGVSSD